MKHCRALYDLADGESGTVCHIADMSGIGTRLMELGITEGANIKCVGISPLGDPSAYMVRGAVIALRSEESKGIYIRSD